MSLCKVLKKGLGGIWLPIESPTCSNAGWSRLWLYDILKPRPHLRILYADPCPHTKSGNVHRLSPYCTQTKYLYADSVCCLQARMEKSRQSLQLWTCSRTARVHLLHSVCQFTCRIWALNRWSDERGLTFLLRIYSPVHVCEIRTVPTTKTSIKNVMWLIFL
jgi:hypothetical protein